MKKIISALVLLAIILGLAGLLFYIFYKPISLPLFEVSNFAGDTQVYSGVNRSWSPAQRGGVVMTSDKIRTDDRGYIDFNMMKMIQLRMGKNSQIGGPTSRLFGDPRSLRLYFDRGVLFVSTEETFSKQKFEIVTPKFVVHPRMGSIFRIDLTERSGIKIGWVGVLKGEVAVTTRGWLNWFNKKTVILKGLEKSEIIKGGMPTDAIRVDRNDWVDLKDGYELMERRPVADASTQVDLSKLAGSLFRNVFDQGTFYTPRLGYCYRRFFEDDATGDVVMKLRYDVFPSGSYVGIYMKTRDLDLSKFRALKMDVKRIPKEGYPESIRVELKTLEGLAKVLTLDKFQKIWHTYEFPLNFKKATEVTDIAFVISNEKAGEFKQGELLLRKFKLVPRKGDPTKEEHLVDLSVVEKS